MKNVQRFVVGFCISFDLQNFVFIKKNRPPFLKDKWMAPGGKIKYEVVSEQPDATYSYPTESPAEAIAREFQEETGVHIKPAAWHCFHIKEYSTNAMVYFFVAFGDYWKHVITTTDEEVAIHTYIDLVFNSGEEYAFDTKYLIDMILSELRSKNLMLLNPKGVNSWKMQKPKQNDAANT